MQPNYVHYIVMHVEAMLGIQKLISVFHHLPNVSPKQLCALAHLGCTHKAGTSYLLKKKCNLHSQRHPFDALANTSPSVSSRTLTEDLLESVESKELWGGEFFKCTEDRKSGATAATSSRKLRLSIPRTRSADKALLLLRKIWVDIAYQEICIKVQKFE